LPKFASLKNLALVKVKKDLLLDMFGRNKS